jgi:D-glycero-D-manno-heptose 1,7-bisphosphate phosphatase
MMNIRHVILDRDGVLNVEASGGWVMHPKEWVWERNALAGLRRLCVNRRVSVATNQSCIGRGLVDSKAIDAVHEHMCAAAVAAGARIDSVWVCPHAPIDGCDCRKPEPGLLTSAIRESGIPPAETLFVGDSNTDLQAGLSAAVAVVIVRTGKGAITESSIDADGVLVLDDLAILADMLSNGAETRSAPGRESGSGLQ